MARLIAGAQACALACADNNREVPADAADPPPLVDTSVVAWTDASRTIEAALIDHTAWQPLEPGADPFWDAQRGYRPCGTADWYIEGTVEPYLELHTGVCNYLTVVQPSLAGVRRGDVVALALSHTSLNGSEAMGHAAVTLGDTELWSKTVPIRAEPESHNIEWIAPAAFPAGTRVAFHVENHGDNAWRLLQLAREPR